MPQKNLKNLKIVFLAMFAFSLYVAITGYINSSFIESFGWGNTIISSIYITNAIITLILLSFSSQIISKLGVRKLLLINLSTLGGVLLGLLFLPASFFHFILFAFMLSLNSFIIFSIDIILEHFSMDEFTGRIRGLFLVLINLTWAIAPIPAGYIIDHFGISLVYVLGFLGVIAALLIFLSHFRKVAFKKPKPVSLTKGIKDLLNNRNRKNIFILAFFLQLFYASAMIYMPLHLHNAIGFNWSEIGILLMVTNLPFLIFQYPVGQLADRYFGEQEMMIFGYVIGGVASVLFAIVTSTSVLVWAGLFFFSRIGISIVEATTESYFFKIVDDHDVDAISFQRKAIPLGYLIAPLIAVVTGFFAPSYNLVFLIIGIMLFIALYPATKIIDTK